MLIHVVNAGETVETVARQYGVDPVRLAGDNGLGGEPLVQGQALAVQFP